MVRGVLNCSEERSAFHKLDKCIKIGEEPFLFTIYNGLQFLKLCKNKCKFIFTTAYSQYAIDGYENDVIDFLLKPITFERFEKSIAKFHHLLQIDSSQEIESRKDYILIKGDSKQKYFKVKVQDILYIKGLNNYICVYTTTSPLLHI